MTDLKEKKIIPGFGWFNLNGKSTTSSPPMPDNNKVTLTEYETITPKRSLGSPVSANDELAKLVSSLSLLSAASKTNPLSWLHIWAKGFIVKVRLRFDPGANGQPSFVSIRATLQLYWPATIVSSQCCTMATRIALTDLLALLLIETCIGISWPW